MTEARKDIDLRKVDRSALRDRSTVRIDPEAPPRSVSGHGSSSLATRMSTWTAAWS